MLYRRGVEGIGDYLSDREVQRLYEDAGERRLRAFFKNKILFHQHFARTGLRQARLLGYSLGTLFFGETDAQVVDSERQLAALVRALIERSATASVFIKPATGAKGAECARLDAPPTGERLATLYRRLQAGSFVFEETIRQHPRLAALCADSVNTTRIITYLDEANLPHFLSAFLRVGVGGSVVDNASAGGLFVAVDLASGRLAPRAYRHLAAGGATYTHHPTTGVVFADFVLPAFDAARHLVQQAAQWLPYPLVGWDVAFAEDGPLLVEGNHETGFSAAEISNGGSLRDPRFRAVFARLLAGRRG